MNTSHAIDSHDDHHAAHGGGFHADGKSYMIGFGLAIVLTAIPFALIMTGTLRGNEAIAAVLTAAAVQVVVHLVYFLHMNGSSAQVWNLTALMFTALVLLILIGGSTWVMFHLNHNMMPMYLE